MNPNSSPVAIARVTLSSATVLPKRLLSPSISTEVDVADVISRFLNHLAQGASKAYVRRHPDFDDATGIGNTDLHGVNEILALVARLNRRRRELRLWGNPAHRAGQRASRLAATVDRHARRPAELHARQLRLVHIGPQNHRVEIRDLVQRLAGLDKLAAIGVAGEHGAGDRARYAALRELLPDLRESGVGRLHLLGGTPLLRLGALNLLAENLVIALRLIELLRRRRLRGDQTLHPLVIAAGDFVLHAQRVELLANLRNVSGCRAALCNQLAVL